MATSIGQYTPVFLPGECPSLTEKPGRPQSTGSQRAGHYQSDPAHKNSRHFLPVASLPQGELNVKVVQLPCGDPGSAKCAGTQTVSAAAVLALSESFYETLVAGDQKPSLASLSLELCPFRHLKGFLDWGPSLLFGTSGT